MTVKKQEIEHNDIIGRKIKVGNFVATYFRHKLQVGKILKITPKKAKVKLLNAAITPQYTGEHYIYPADMITVDGEHLTFYLMKINE